MLKHYLSPIVTSFFCRLNFFGSDVFSTQPDCSSIQSNFLFILSTTQRFAEEDIYLTRADHCVSRLAFDVFPGSYSRMEA